MSTAPGRRRVGLVSPEDEHLACVLRGCDCAEFEEERLRYDEALRRAEVRLRREAQERTARREGLALTRRLLTASWDLEHAPRVWVTWDGRGWAEPWRRAWARRRGDDRERWVEEWVRRAGLTRRSPLAGRVLMPDFASGGRRQ